MSYLVDSDWVIDYLKGRPDAVSLMSRAFPQGLAISIVSYAEVFEGILFGRDRHAVEEHFANMLRGMAVPALSRPIARRAAGESGALKAVGQKVPLPDLLIAATALHHDLNLLTRNLRHYGRVPVLKIGLD